jgi:hypothetical protein
LILGHRPSFGEKFWLAPIHPPLVAFSDPSWWIFDDRVRIQFVHCGSQPDKLAWGSSRDCSPDSAQVTVNKCVASMPHRSMSSPGISNESGACATVGWSHGLPPQQATPMELWTEEPQRCTWNRRPCPKWPRRSVSPRAYPSLSLLLATCSSLSLSLSHLSRSCIFAARQWRADRCCMRNKTQLEALFRPMRCYPLASHRHYRNIFRHSRRRRPIQARNVSSPLIIPSTLYGGAVRQQQMPHAPHNINYTRAVDYCNLG